MVKYCIIPQCTNNSMNCNFSFHRFPTNEDLQNQWKSAAGIGKILKFSYVCSSHFEDDCIIKIGHKNIIKSGSLPTKGLGKCNVIFDTPKRNQVTKKKRKLNFDTNNDNAIRHDHTYSSPKLSYEECMIQVRSLKVALQAANEKIKVLQRKVKRNSEIKEKLKGIVNKCSTLHKNEKGGLNNTIDGMPNELFRRLEKNVKSNHTNSMKYSPELRTLALTINFLSPKAYAYVRKELKNCLPHPRTIGKWYGNINGDVGINEEALNAISNHMKKQPDLLLCITFDEMSIRKQIDFDGKNNIGFVDWGNGCESNDQPATSALVFMAIAVNANWKIPIAYYFVHNVSAEEKCGILLQILGRLHDLNAKVISVTCDGPAAHIRMAEMLGVSANLESFNSSFYFRGRKLFFILDSCHMIKLMRNALFDLGYLYDSDGKEINSKYIVSLHELQQNEHLVLANKLSESHIQFKKQIMKVKLATQTLSSSVADAIDFCREILCLPQFHNSEATTRFIRFCDRLFDISNSKSPIDKNFKAPIKQENFKFWSNYFDEAFSYFSNVKVKPNKLAIHSKRKTPFLGFLTLINSFRGIYDNYIKEGQLKYLLTYKLSQDHLELFFSSIRSKGGYNNNPSCRQFSSIFKKLLIHHELKHNNSNCDGSITTPILNITSSLIPKKTENSDDDNFINTDHFNVNEIDLNDIEENVSEYIAGFICRKLKKIIKCTTCSAAAVNNDKTINNTHTLVSFKDRGGLVFPSIDVINICQLCEKICQSALNDNSIRHNIFKTLISNFFDNMDQTIFENLDDAINSHDVNHRLLLIEQIAKFYFKIRIHHANKLFNLKIKGSNVRPVLTKSILFKNQ